MPEERQITTKEQLLDEMCAALGGRAAEDITFNKISTGALSDLEKITKQAYSMVSIYGLNDKIGHISFYDSSGQSEYSFNKPYSEKTAQVIDEEVSKMVSEAYERTKKILIENQDKLVKLAELLLVREVIFKEDLEKIFGERAFGEKSRTDQLLDENAEADKKSKSTKSESKIKDWTPEEPKTNGKHVENDKKSEEDVTENKDTPS